MKISNLRTVLVVLLILGVNTMINAQNPDHLKVAHYQLACIPEDVNANIERVVSGVREAASENIDIISFPESFLTGYFMQGDKARKNSLRIDGPEIRGLLEKTSEYDTTFIVGFNELRGNELFNTALIAEQGKCLGKYSKAFWMALVAYSFTAFGQFGLDMPQYIETIVYALLNTLVVIGILADTGKAGFGFDLDKIIDRLKHPVSLLAIMSLVVLVGNETGLYQIPVNYQDGVKTILDALVFLGILVNPSTKGLDD